MITIECDTANIDWLDIVYMPKSSHSLWYLRYGTVRRSFVAIVLDQQKTRYSEDPRLKLQQKIKFNNCLNLRVIKPQKKQWFMFLNPFCIILKGRVYIVRAMVCEAAPVLSAAIEPATRSAHPCATRWFVYRKYKLYWYIREGISR